MGIFLQKYIHVVEILSFLSFLSLIILLPFPWRWSHPFYVAWFVLWILEGRWLNRKNFYLAKSQIPTLLICLFVIWEIVSLLWSLDVQSGMRELTKHAPIFIIGLIVLFGTNKYYDVLKIKITFVVGCLLSALCYCTLIYQHSLTNTLWSNPPFWYNSSVWTLFGDGPIGFIMHRHFYCLVLLLAIFFSVDLFHFFKTKYSPYRVGGLVAIVHIIFTSIIVLTGSRMAILFLPIAVLIIFFYNDEKGRRKNKIIGLGILGILFLWIGFSYNVRMTIVKDDISKLFEGDSTSIANTNEPRLLIHSCILRHRHDYGLVGLGLGSSFKMLQQYYAEDDLLQFYARGFDSHNMYLKFWMEQGPFAPLFVLFILFFSPFFHSARLRKHSVYVCSLFGWGLLTENELDRMWGLHIFFAILVILYLEQRKEDVSPRSHP